MKINLAKAAKKIKSAFFGNNAVDDNVVRTNGKLAIAVSENRSSVHTTCKTDIYDTGFYKFDTACSDLNTWVRFVYLKQTAKPNGLDSKYNYMRVNELRLYQTPNLFEAVPSLEIRGPNNGLMNNQMQNLSSRTSRGNNEAIVDLDGGKATQGSCNAFRRSSYASRNYKIPIKIDLQSSFF